MDILGDYLAGSTVRAMWNSNAVAGESITRATNGSLRVYKNSLTAERTSSNGITDTEDFDSLTGVHHYSIDLSDNSDAGFYAAGNDYFVVLSAATIDGKSINAVLAMFSIENKKPILHTTQPSVTFSAMTVTNAFTVSDGIIVTASTLNRNAITATGNGTGNGLQVQGGATGHGLRMIGGSTSGYGFYITTTSGHGGVSAPSGSGMAGMYLVGNSNGHALRLEAAGTGSGLYAKGGASGPGGSFVGGSSSGAGISITTTSGNGFDITPTAGHGISIAANGSDKHGLFVTGGTAGTSDGMKLVAGTGGVQFRSDITGTLSTVTTLTNAPSDSAGVTTLLARLTGSRAGYMDNLNVGGLVASSSEVTSVQNNTRCVRVVPDVIERPDSGTVEYRVELFLYDVVGNMEAPDSAPTITLVNQAGTDRSARLDSTTMALVETGRYRAIYTASSSDSLEQLVWAFSVVEGGNTRKYGNGSLIVDTTAVDFTAADRIKLESVYNDWLDGGRLDSLLDQALADTNELQTDWADNGRLELKLDAILDKGEAIQDDVAAVQTEVENNSIQIGLVKAKTDTIVDVYHAEIRLDVDDSNSTDEYTVVWYKNGVRVTSGITSPTIQVVKRVDGSDLITSTAMTQVASTGAYKYDATTTKRLTAGDAGIVLVGATIDAGSRTYAKIVGRDSEAA